MSHYCYIIMWVTTTTERDEMTTNFELSYSIEIDFFSLKELNFGLVSSCFSIKGKLEEEEGQL